MVASRQARRAPVVQGACRRRHPRASRLLLILILCLLLLFLLLLLFPHICPISQSRGQNRESKTAEKDKTTVYRNKKNENKPGKSKKEKICKHNEKKARAQELTVEPRIHSNAGCGGGGEAGNQKHSPTHSAVTPPPTRLLLIALLLPLPLAAVLARRLAATALAATTAAANSARVMRPPGWVAVCDLRVPSSSRLSCSSCCLQEPFVDTMPLVAFSSPYMVSGARHLRSPCPSANAVCAGLNWSSGLSLGCTADSAPATRTLLSGLETVAAPDDITAVATVSATIGRGAVVVGCGTALSSVYPLREEAAKVVVSPADSGSLIPAPVNTAHIDLFCTCCASLVGLS